MMSCTLFEDIGVCLMEPAERLSEGDFNAAAGSVNDYLASHDGLNGLVIHAEFFPWWADFAAMLNHLQFAGGQHQKLNRVAICSDSEVSGLLPKFDAHFSAAQVRSYKGEEVSEAMHWVRGEAD